VAGSTLLCHLVTGTLPCTARAPPAAVSRVVRCKCQYERGTGGPQPPHEGSSATSAFWHAWNDAVGWLLCEPSLQNM
jgi:hypothetical protein